MGAASFLYWRHTHVLWHWARVDQLAERLDYVAFGGSRLRLSRLCRRARFASQSWREISAVHAADEAFCAICVLTNSFFSCEISAGWLSTLGLGAFPC